MRRIVVLAAALAFVAAAVWLLWPDQADGPPPFLGYVEAETMLVAPKQTGRLVELAVTEGATVETGAPLFALDAETETAAVQEAQARLGRAKAQLADLRAAQQRPAQIDVLEASRRQAEAALELSRAELERQKRLFDRGVVAESRLDQATSTYKRDLNALAETERAIEAARLPGREAQVEAAEAEVEVAAAALEQARIALADRRVEARRGGRVLDVLYRVGEVVPAGQPVVEILPPTAVKVRFYVPEPAISRLSYGQPVEILCDGCPPGLAAAVTYIAPEAEFTPPVIFSRQERAKLVFLVEARPASPSEALRPGLPVEVRPQ